MRPHSLEFTAIGSYPGTVNVDFDALAPQGLFHIHGPTGAGKSSLIDAMCFALYGTIPGPRLADGLRSHHADPKVEAVVRFTFSAQDSTWRVVRTPAQLRAKLRGDGTTHQYATASLQRREGGGWAPVASGSKEVDPIMHKLLGLDATQFMQVVVLPQGGFQKVLRAGADEREKLLRHLFGTERFDRYTQELKQRADSQKQRIDTYVHAQRSTAQRIATTLASFDLTIDDFPGTIDDTVLAGVRSAQQHVDGRATSASLEAEKLTKEAEKSEVVLRRQVVLWERWKRRLGAENRLAALDEDREEIDALREELTRAERAAPLAPLQAALDEAQRAFLSSTATRQVAQSAIRTMLGAGGSITGETQLCDALSRLAAVVPSAIELDNVRRSLRTRATEVHVAADLARQALDAKADIEHFENQLPPLAATQEELQKTNDSLHQSKKRLESQLSQLEEASANQAQLGDQIRVIENRLAAAEALTNEQRRTAEIEKALHIARDQAESARRQQLELVERRIQAMAGELASSLVDGEACTVCGSTSHPAPAAWVDIVSQDDIAGAAQAVSRQAAVVSDIESQREEAKAREAAYSAAAADAVTNMTGVTANVNDLRIQLAVADNAAAQTQQRRTELDDVIARLRRVEQDQLRTTEQRIITESRLQEATSRLQQLESRIGEQASNHVIELAGAIEAAHESVDVLANSLDEERRRAEAMEGARVRLAENAEAYGVSDVVDSLAFLRNEEQLNMLRTRVQRWDEARANAEATLAEAVVSAMTEEPDITAAEATLQAARAAQQAAVENAAELGARSRQLQLSVDDLFTEYEQFKPLVEEYERTRTLADICHGRGNTMKQSLERYILASYLEEVAEAAGKRLQLMSAGRYSLRHSDARVRGNGASGLALLVTDAYTGQEREVSTLSGGETFLASLALALGLADTVQAKSGGVHIDALFIDEGFGSLDVDALELAMAELDRLREGGRLVGVISHVAALRERIPAGIEVVSGPTGSTIKQNNILTGAGAV